MTMCNQEHLVGYIYDEMSPAEKTAFEAHLTGCASCRLEISELKQTRQHLARWSPPEPEFDFTVVQTPRRSPDARKRWSGLVPQWAVAAAAALFVVAGAAAVANLEVRYAPDGSLVVRTGWAGTRSPAGAGGGPVNEAPAVPASATPASSEQVKDDVIALQRRVQELQQSLDQSTAERARVTNAGSAGVSIAELRKILAESEARQRTELAMHMGQVWKDFSAARVNDWSRMQQTLVQAQGLTNAQLRQQRESLDSLRYLQISQQK